MMRRILIGLLLIAGTVRIADAQTMSKASQVVTFSVRTTHHTVIAGTLENLMPSDLKVTATLDGSSNETGSHAIDVRSMNQLQGGDHASASAGDNSSSTSLGNHSNTSFGSEGTVQTSNRTVVLTVTQ